MERSAKWFEKEKILNWVFWLFISILLLNRVLIFFTINIHFIDSDQPFLWIGCSDYARGLFYEPRFYGQDYNTFLEPLIGVPFVWLGFPVYYAVPIATHILFLFPVLFTAFYLFKKKKKEHAIMVIAMILCLTHAFDILTSIPRGFVTGLFFTSFYIISFLGPRHLRSFLLNGFFSVIAYMVNPNSVIVSVPFFIYVFLHNYSEKKFYLFLSLILFSYIPLYFLLDHFYRLHPDVVIYGLQYGLSGEYFLQNISHLDKAFQHISHFIEGSCIPVLVLLALITFASFKQDKKLFCALIGFAAIILGSFFSGKVSDGSEWPFYSFSRMYLGIPVCFYLFISVLKVNRRFLMTLIVPVVILYSGYKFLAFNKAIKFHGIETPWLGVHLIDLKRTTETIELYKQFALKENADHFVISNGFWLNTFLAYGGPAIDKNFPSTEETNSERRYWVREGNKNKVFPKFLLLSSRYDLDKIVDPAGKFQIQRIDDFGLFLITGNNMRNADFLLLVKKTESL